LIIIGCVGRLCIIHRVFLTGRGNYFTTPRIYCNIEECISPLTPTLSTAEEHRGEGGLKCTAYFEKINCQEQDLTSEAIRGLEERLKNLVRGCKGGYFASQAVISSAFSLTRQAIQLGYLPRLKIQHTSAAQMGQIYIAPVNWMLMLCTIAI
jgi:hypothetical protein